MPTLHPLVRVDAVKLAKLRQATELLVKVHEHWPLSVSV
jgi:hypothetical protein